MSALPLPLADSVTMVRRNLLHMRAYPSMTLMLIGQPIVFLLLFVYVFGGTLGAGIAGASGASGGRAEYLNYVTPAILLMTVASVSLGTAVSIAMDMQEGIVARFRTMAIARTSILTGHVIGALIQTVIALAAVLGVAVLLGFRAGAGLAPWLGVLGLLMALAFALTWLTIAMGLACKSVETASNVPILLVLLPFLGSGFVPTDSMPSWLRWFAENQPFTPVIETVRHLLDGTPAGHQGWIAVAWCAGIAITGFFWAERLYNREPAQ